ncbi:MAG: efflux RND transporter periplasmic adaptor subunit [Planctomycetota bacterium]
MDLNLLLRARSVGPRVRCGGLLLALAGLPACSDASADQGEPAAREEVEAIHVAVATVELGDLVSTYGTSATLRAEARATVASRTRGVVEAILAEEGDRVLADQMLAQLEDDEQELALKRARSVHEIKQREFNRLTKLNEEKIVSDSEIELVRREAAEAELDVELAELNLDRTAIRAPFDGILVTRQLDVGATVADGTEMFELADIDPLFADVSVPERHVGQLAPGQKVRLRADGVEAPVDARIERLAPVVDPTTGTVKVTVAVEGAVSLRPGAFVEVQIVTEVHTGVRVVPRSALVAEGRRWLVFRPVDGGSKVEAIEVELGFEEGDRVEVAASGEGRLEVGDEVVATGASALSDGAPVRILAPAAEKGE